MFPWMWVAFNWCVLCAWHDWCNGDLFVIISKNFAYAWIIMHWMWNSTLCCYRDKLCWYWMSTVIRIYIQLLVSGADTVDKCSIKHTHTQTHTRKHTQCPLVSFCHSYWHIENITSLFSFTRMLRQMENYNNHCSIFFMV